MKVYISCDIEGVGCVVRPEHSRVDGRDYIQSRRLMTEEVNAAVRGAFDAGASSVVIADSHNVGLNILPELLDERAELIMGTPRPMSMVEGVDQGFDACLFIGYHAKPGTQNGVIQHNHHGRIQNFSVNGVSMGELGLNAAVAGLYGVPVALVSGDQVTCEEAAALLPWVETVAVKRGIGMYSAQCLHPNVCRKMIYDATMTALKQPASMKPLLIETPVELVVTCTTVSGADKAQLVPGYERSGPLEVKGVFSDLRAAYKAFLVVTNEVETVFI